MHTSQPDSDRSGTADAGTDEVLSRPRASEERRSASGELSGTSSDLFFGTQNIPGFGTAFNRNRWTPVDTTHYLENRSWEPIASLLEGARRLESRDITSSAAECLIFGRSEY